MSSRRYFIGFALLCLALGLGAAGYRVGTDLYHEMRVATLKKNLALAEKKAAEADPWPFIHELKKLKLSPRQLGKQHEVILKGLALKKAAHYTESIEASLYQRAYPKAYEDLHLLKKLLAVFGNPEELLPTYPCLELAYQDHQWNYPTDEEEPALRWKAAPPPRLCTTDPHL